MLATAGVITFQSTLPARGATGRSAGTTSIREDFNPRSPHGERLACGSKNAAQTDFNPRSPHGERHVQQMIRAHKSHFNPRSPHGERPTSVESLAMNIIFQSTLPARGATLDRLPLFPCTLNFNPRSPHGERHPHCCAVSQMCPFQSTLPARGATRHSCRVRRLDVISIHAPRTGSDGAK